MKKTPPWYFHGQNTQSERVDDVSKGMQLMNVFFSAEKLRPISIIHMVGSAAVSSGR